MEAYGSVDAISDPPYVAIEKTAKPKELDILLDDDIGYSKPDLRSKGNQENRHHGHVVIPARPGKRQFDRRDGTGRGHTTQKREGSGSHNWGTIEDELRELENPETEEEKNKLQPEGDEINLTQTKQTNDELNVSEKEPQKETVLTMKEFLTKQDQNKKDILGPKKERIVDDNQFKGLSSLHNEQRNLITPAASKKKKKPKQKNIDLVDKDLIGFSMVSEIPHDSPAFDVSKFKSSGTVPNESGEQVSQQPSKINESNEFPRLC